MDYVFGLLSTVGPRLAQGLLILVIYAVLFALVKRYWGWNGWPREADDSGREELGRCLTSVSTSITRTSMVRPISAAQRWSQGVRAEVHYAAEESLRRERWERECWEVEVAR